MPDFFRSFLPLENPLGFGAGDYLELLLAAMLLAALIWWKRIAPRRQSAGAADRLVDGAAGVAACCSAAGAAAAIIPCLLPDVYDEFSHLLVADTLRHFRLANPMHPLHQFFETFFVLQSRLTAPSIRSGRGSPWRSDG
jgi:hypothetical protein